VVLAATLGSLMAGGLLAQEPAGSVSGIRFTPRAQAIPLLTSSPVPDGDRLAEVRLVQPVLAADLSMGNFRLSGTVNLEGATLPEGELTLGAWGEGFVDRRHPHTWVHELMLTWTGQAGPVQVGAGVGKGFAPFGTDDPMSRPAVRYPVNHHLSQVLERAVLLGQVEFRRLRVEIGLFNGDEPERPGQWPNLDRFGDSWSLRASAVPFDGLELQLSRATIKSPEHRQGSGLDHRQWSASARLETRAIDRPVYGMAEWARTDVGQNDFRFDSWLVEGAIRLGRIRPYYRLERSERPEEERVSAFRSRRPPLDNSIVGISRWTVHTVGMVLPFSVMGWHLEPLAELSAGSIAKAGGGLFEVSDWYDGSRFVALSAGLRIEVGMKGHRMGRYGLAGSAGHGSHGL
jgi:hypothetical protein